MKYTFVLKNYIYFLGYRKFCSYKPKTENCLRTKLVLKNVTRWRYTSLHAKVYVYIILLLLF